MNSKNVLSNLKNIYEFKTLPILVIPSLRNSSTDVENIAIFRPLV